MNRLAGTGASRRGATVVPALILAAALLTGGCHSGGDGEPVLIDGALPVLLTGDHYEWRVRYAGADGEFDTGDDRHTDRDVHVPAHTKVVLLLHSRDYIYVLALPHIGLEEAAVPDLEFSLRFDSGPPGEFVLKGDQMCGLPHPKLMGKLVVQDSGEFRTWLGTLRQGRR